MHTKYDPGCLPTRPAPTPGETITITLDGLPPFKSVRESLRSPRGRQFSPFMALRTAATAAMAGRAWYTGPVELDLLIIAPSLPPAREPNDYLGGVMDTLDGSHGTYFTFLPIVFEDDCQVCGGSTIMQHSPDTVRYRVVVRFSPEGARSTRTERRE